MRVGVEHYGPHQFQAGDLSLVKCSSARWAETSMAMTAAPLLLRGPEVMASNSRAPGASESLTAAEAESRQCKEGLFLRVDGSDIEVPVPCGLGEVNSHRRPMRVPDRKPQMDAAALQGTGGHRPQRGVVTGGHGSAFCGGLRP